MHGEVLALVMPHPMRHDAQPYSPAKFVHCCLCLDLTPLSSQKKMYESFLIVYIFVHFMKSSKTIRK